MLIEFSRLSSSQLPNGTLLDLRAHIFVVCWHFCLFTYLMLSICVYKVDGQEIFKLDGWEVRDDWVFHHQSMVFVGSDRIWYYSINFLLFLKESLNFWRRLTCYVFLLWRAQIVCTHSWLCRNVLKLTPVPSPRTF